MIMMRRSSRALTWLRSSHRYLIFFWFWWQTFGRHRSDPFVQSVSFIQVMHSLKRTEFIRMIRMIVIIMILCSHLLLKLLTNQLQTQTLMVTKQKLNYNNGQPITNSRQPTMDNWFRFWISSGGLFKLLCSLGCVSVHGRWVRPFWSTADQAMLCKTQPFFQA